MISRSDWFDCIPGGLTLSMYICNTRSLVHSNLTSKETMIWWKQNSIFNSCWNTEFIPTHGCIDNRFKWMIRWGKTNILAFRAEKNYSKKKPKKRSKKQILRMVKDQITDRNCLTRNVSWISLLEHYTALYFCGEIGWHSLLLLSLLWLHLSK